MKWNIYQSKSHNFSTYLVDNNGLFFVPRELIESMIINKKMRVNSTQSMGEIADSLVNKNNQLKKYFKLAQDQEQLKKKMDLFKVDLNKEEEEIKNLTKALKEAEHLLATALYQAKQKLNLIRQANSHPISSEDLIKYAHKISSAHSVAAPYNWEQGDLRRPYPTDLEMRSGWIAKLQTNEYPLTSADMLSMYAEKQPVYSQPMASYPSLQPQQSFIERGLLNPSDRPSSTASTGSNSSYAWQQELKPPLPGMTGGLPHPSPLENKPSTNKQNLEDVEVMSTDSSTSSSSDSNP